MPAKKRAIINLGTPVIETIEKGSSPFVAPRTKNGNKYLAVIEEALKLRYKKQFVRVPLAPETDPKKALISIKLAIKTHANGKSLKAAMLTSGGIGIIKEDASDEEPTTATKKPEETATATKTKAK